MKKRIVTFFRQLFCRHTYELTNSKEIFPFPKPGEIISFTREHTCPKCAETVTLGSGLHFG